MFCFNDFFCFNLHTVSLIIIIFIIICLYFINQQSKQHYLLLKNKITETSTKK